MVEYVGSQKNLVSEVSACEKTDVAPGPGVFG